MSNEAFRSLVQRAQWADDIGATNELVVYLLGIIKPKARRFPDPSARDDVVQTLLMAGMRAARATVTKPVARPRNYTVRAIGHAYISKARDLSRSRRRERPDAFEGHLDPADPLSHDGHDHVHMRDLLRNFRREQTGEVATKIADVIELRYLLDTTEFEACRLLDFDGTETETVLRTIRRWRAQPTSPIQRLAGQIRDSAPSNADNEHDNPREC